MLLAFKREDLGGQDSRQGLKLCTCRLRIVQQSVQMTFTGISGSVNDYDCIIVLPMTWIVTLDDHVQVCDCVISSAAWPYMMNSIQNSMMSGCARTVYQITK